MRIAAGTAAVAVIAALAGITGGDGVLNRAAVTRAVLKQLRLPLAFEPGQERGAYVAHAAGYDVRVRPAALALDLPGHRSLHVRLEGASARASLVARRKLPGTVSYLVGADRSRWRRGLPTFARITARGVYPGIDLAYHGRAGRLEYDFVLKPRARVEDIALRFAGVGTLRVARDGALLLPVGRDMLRQPPPLAYQVIGGERRKVVSRFALRGGTVGFAVGPYDSSLELVIDPTLVYSTYLGRAGDDAAQGIALDAAGNAYVSGCTQNMCNDAFVVKFNPAGTPVYAMYFGGSADDTPLAIGVDGSGQATVTGFTVSTDWPTVNPYQPASAGAEDIFLTKLNAQGTGFVYSTYLGGAGDDVARDVKLDSSGNAHVAGWTTSTNFPTAAAYQPANAGGSDAIVATLNAAGSALLYSSYLGGTTDDEGSGLALDPTGNTYLSGSTNSTNFPTVNPYQPAFAGNVDGFVAKLNSSGNALLYSTYLGGGTIDFARGISIDSTGNAYVGGYTLSTSFPATAGAYQTANAGDTDGFVTKLGPAGNTLVYSTYLGGSAGEIASAPALDSAGNAYVTGYTRSSNFPAVNPVQAANGGGQDAYLAKLSSSGGSLVYSTYLGGTNSEYGYGVRVDGAGNAYVEGWTVSTDFPTANPFQAANAGGLDAFVAKFSSATTAVELTSFSARRSSRGVLLGWRAGAGARLLAFDLYRGRVHLTRRPIPGGSRAYSYLDTRGRPGDVYRLRVTRTDGTRTWRTAKAR